MDRRSGLTNVRTCCFEKEARKERKKVLTRLTWKQDRWRSKSKEVAMLCVSQDSQAGNPA